MQKRDRDKCSFRVLASLLLMSLVACVTPPLDESELVAESNMPPSPYNRYQIVNANSGRCLDVTDISQANGAPLQLWDCAPGGQLNQVWDPEQVYNFYVFSSANSPPGTNKTIDVDLVPGTHTRGARFQQWDLAWTVNQVFTLRSAIIPGHFQIIAYHSGLCMETIGAGTSNGTKIQQNDCGPSEPLHQLWSFRAVP